MNIFSSIKAYLYRKTIKIIKYLKHKKTIRQMRTQFWEDFNSYNRLIKPKSLDKRMIFPIINEKTKMTNIDPIYYFQDNWAFKKIIKSGIEKHVDIGSHHKFVGFLSIIIKTTMVDIRPPSVRLDSINFIYGSILKLPFKNNSLQSVSSLCVIEHIGLGRYGDKLNPKGTEESARELKRVIKIGGSLYISVPIENENRIYFNAHRAFTEEYILSLFSPLILKSSKYIIGKKFVDKKPEGSCVGCYHFMNTKK